jgi:hypothetical protein
MVGRKVMSFIVKMLSDDEGRWWTYEEDDIGEDQEFGQMMMNSLGGEKHRCEYGKGSEAKITRRYRQFDVLRSPTFVFLQTRCPKHQITKKILLTIINAFLASNPDYAAIPRPSRTQHRAKNGLVEWLDVNGPAVMNFLCTFLIKPH